MMIELVRVSTKAFPSGERRVSTMGSSSDASLKSILITAISARDRFTRATMERKRILKMTGKDFLG
jgi:hypothetical protein